MNQPLKNNIMQYHPELAVEYLSNTYHAGYGLYGVRLNMIHLAKIYGLDVEIDYKTSSVIRDGTFRGNPISKRAANALLHSELYGRIFYGKRSGKFRKLWYRSHNTRHFTDAAFDYIVNELHCELLRAKLPLAPAKLFPYYCSAGFIRALPTLPSPAALSSGFWPKHWQIVLGLTQRGEVGSARCPSLDVVLNFDYGYKRPQATDLGPLRWWVLAQAVSCAMRGVKSTVAGELLTHAQAMGLSNAIQVKILIAIL